MITNTEPQPIVAVVVAGAPEERAVFLDLDDRLVLVVGDDDVRLRPREGGAQEQQADRQNSPLGHSRSPQTTERTEHTENNQEI